MSKAFEEWWENTAVSGNRKKAMDAAFTAGRALGRREPKGEAKAWLITGGKMYKDAVVQREETADARLATRGNDGSYKVPLYAIEAILEEV